MNDAINDGMDTADDEEEADKVYSQICDEIGVEYGDVDGQLALGPVKGKEEVKGGSGAEMDDLASRLDALKK